VFEDNLVLVLLNKFDSRLDDEVVTVYYLNPKENSHSFSKEDCDKDK
jgi:hypothetical protein